MSGVAGAFSFTTVFCKALAVPTAVLQSEVFVRNINLAVFLFCIV
jgi:hypothetical protein